MRKLARILVVVAFVGGCAQPVGSASLSVPAAPAAAAPQVPSAGLAADAGQVDSCDGVQLPVQPPRLRTDQRIAEAVICDSSQRYVAGRGVLSVQTVYVVNHRNLVDLQEGLTRADMPAPAVCDAMGYLLPAFVITLTDGSRIRPGIPSDGCHPVQIVRDALATTSDQVRSTTLGQVLVSDAVARSNCSPRAKGPVVWATLHQPAAVAPSRPSAGAISVCRYGGDVSGATLRFVGVVLARDAAKVWPISVAPTATLRCSTDPTVNGATSSFLFLSRTPSTPRLAGPDGSGLLGLIEVDGCHRYLSAVGGLIGYLSIAQITALAALADESVG